jgi:hypothetical protein
MSLERGESKVSEEKNNEIKEREAQARKDFHDDVMVLLEEFGWGRKSLEKELNSILEGAGK